MATGADTISSARCMERQAPPDFLRGMLHFGNDGPFGPRKTMSTSQGAEAPIVVVTGASGLIGGMIATRFLDAGARVIGADLSATDVPSGVHYQRLDVRSDADWELLESMIGAEYRRLDVLVNVAGVIIAGDIETVDRGAWDLTLATNITGTFLGCRYGVRMMKRSGGGAIINFSSAMARRPQAVQPAYSASKAAIESLTRSTAIHCGQRGYGIRVNCIEPGAIDSPMLRRNNPADVTETAYLESVRIRHPIGRLGTAMDIANAVLFLASDQASYITGAVLPVDGGATA